MLLVDLSAPPSEKERAKLATRRARLEAMAKSADAAASNMKVLADSGSIESVRIRYPFMRLSKPAGTLRGDPSDRRLPDRADRPPASRIMSPTGSALRFYLTAIFEAQTRVRPGQQPANSRPLLAGGDEISWIDLLASPAQPAGSGETYMSVSAKKARQVKNALQSLAGEELVELTRGRQPGNKYEKFQLLHEGGRRTRGETPRYHVPREDEQAFPVPVTLFTSGWIHVLEDTELLMVLMLTALHHQNSGQPFKIDGETRLLRYGIGRNAYAGHFMLSALGLATVTPDPGRHFDGKVEGYNEGEHARLHTFAFHPGQLDRDALPELRAQLDYRLGR